MGESIYRMVKKDGSVIFTAHRGKAQFNSFGNPIRMVGTTRDVHEKMEISNKLREQNELINTILNNSPQLIFVKDRFGNFLKVNQKTADLFGKSIEEVEQVHNRDLHKVEDELAVFDEVEREVFREMKPVTVEERFTDYKGNELIFSTNKSPLTRPNGEVDILGISTDITELKRSQIVLLKKEREYGSILESLRIVVGRLDSSARFTYFNPALVKYLKFHRIEDIIRISIKNVVSEDEWPTFERQFYRVLNREKRHVEGRINIDTPKGFRWLEYSMTKQDHRDGESEVFISLYDITDQVRFSQELERSENIFRTITENSADIICLHGPRGHIRYTSPATKKLLGYTNADLVGKQAINYICPEDYMHIERLIRQLHSNTKVSDLAQVRVRHKDESYIWLEVTASLVYDSSGEVWMVQSSSRDISRRKKVEEEHARNLAREAELNDFQRSFVMMSSHQLRTPLTVINSDVDLLQLIYTEKESSPDRKAVMRIVKRMGASVHRMTYLMEDILTLGKLDAGAIEMHVQEVSLMTVIDELVTTQFSPLPSGRNLDVLWEIEDALVDLDRDLFSQALANFITNADKYSPGKRNPRVEISRKGKKVQINVVDFGIGIPREDKSRLFQPFFRGSNTADYRGTGLGLRIAKDFVQMNNGKLKVKSQEGDGTTMSITLKAKQIF
jgi:PAS domain S-box-containing protein